MQSYCNLLSCVITLCILHYSAQNAYTKNGTAIITAIIEGMWHCLQAAANIWATMYYFTGRKSFTGIVLGEKARHSMTSLSMAYKTFCGNLRTD